MIFKQPPASECVPHEYGPSRVGHGEAQCRWCLGTNRENAIIAPNHCDKRADALANEQTETGGMTEETMGDVVVTQADRNAAVRLLEAGGQDWHAKEIRLGHGDHFPTTQAFARHRIEASRPAPSEASGDVVDLVRRMQAYLNRNELAGRPTGISLMGSAIEALSATQAPQADALHPVLVEIMAEVEKATRKFPTWPTRIIDAGNVVSEEAGELAKACLQVTYEPDKETLKGVRMEAVQTAAMAFRFLCSIERYDCTPGEQHEQDPPRALTESQTNTEAAK